MPSKGFIFNRSKQGADAGIDYEDNKKIVYPGYNE